LLLRRPQQFLLRRHLCRSRWNAGGPASTAWRKSVSSDFRQIACTNHAFPRAKLARHLRCAAL